MGIRALIARVLRRLSEAMVPMMAYFTLAFGRRKRTSIEPDTSIVEVRDRGSDVTVISFAGLVALHGGMVNFEFMSLLRKHGIEANLVFVRDPLCSCYHLAPDGGHDGLAYYEARLRAVLEKLGSRYHVAIGTSIGGMAATLFGNRLGMDQVIAFSPSWPLERYTIRGGLRGRLRTFKLLFKKPAAYIERLILGQMARISLHTLRSTVGETGMVDLEGELARSKRLPRITAYYGEGCEPDLETSAALAKLGAHTIALPTAMHNTTAFLKQRGDLVTLIRDSVDAAMQDRGVARLKTMPPPAMAPEEVTTLVAGVAT